MLVIVNQVRQEHREDIQWLQLGLSLQVTDSHEKVHGLERVYNMHLIVIAIAFGVALVDFQAKFVAHFH